MPALYPQIALEAFDVHPERGFLPATDPLRRLPAAFDAWEETAHRLPKLLVSDRLRACLEALPPFDVAHLGDDRETRRAMLLLSYLGHAYVWGGPEPAAHLPAVIAIPWHAVAERLGRPPVLSYASYALDNWERLDPQGDIALGNIALIQNFLGGMDEEWFILIHVDIEAKAAPALAALPLAQQAAQEDRPDALERHLTTLEAALSRMFATLARMPEHCDPYIYYHRVRPYIHGWKNHPALPEGVVYEGVTAYGGKPQLFRGETGAQSTIIPALDAALGVSHRDDPLKAYLLEMRSYMPERHRAFLAALEQQPSVRDYLLDRHAAPSTLHDLYNACMTWVERFRALHLQYAATYIHQQAQKDPANPAHVGTGGTPFMLYLKKHRDETAEHLLPADTDA
jgi:indoleamine 2,3-dioxygenase